jgi:hypothetical protein
LRAGQTQLKKINLKHDALAYFVSPSVTKKKSFLTLTQNQNLLKNFDRNKLKNVTRCSKLCWQRQKWGQQDIRKFKSESKSERDKKGEGERKRERREESNTNDECLFVRKRKKSRYKKTQSPFFKSRTRREKKEKVRNRESESSRIRIRE